jgi:hypothetical protein
MAALLLGFLFTKGIQNFSGNTVNIRVGTVRGIQGGGFGHTNPWPISLRLVE